MGALRIKEKGNPWGKIYIPVTYVGISKETKIIHTLIDTGATVSYMGINYIEGLGYKFNLNGLTLNHLVGMYGITDNEPSSTGKQPRPHPNKRIYASCALDIKNIILDDIVITTPRIRIPVSFTYSTDGTIINPQFERKNSAIIGTDILRKYNYGVNADHSPPLFTITIPTRDIPQRAIKLQTLKFED